MRFLIVEDDLNKRDQLKAFLSASFPPAAIEATISYQSGLNALISNPPDVLILDMQLPTFDKSPAEDGGRRRSLAGLELLRQIGRRKIQSYAVVVTQLREFGDDGDKMSLDELRRKLAEMKLSNYRGLVYYHPKLSNWKDELAELIAKIGNRKK